MKCTRAVPVPPCSFLHRSRCCRRRRRRVNLGCEEHRHRPCTHTEKRTKRACVPSFPMRLSWYRRIDAQLGLSLVPVANASCEVTPRTQQLPPPPRHRQHKDKETPSSFLTSVVREPKRWPFGPRLDTQVRCCSLTHKHTHTHTLSLSSSLTFALSSSESTATLVLCA